MADENKKVEVAKFDAAEIEQKGQRKSKLVVLAKKIATIGVFGTLGFFASSKIADKIIENANKTEITQDAPETNFEEAIKEVGGNIEETKDVSLNDVSLNDVSLNDVSANNEFYEENVPDAVKNATTVTNEEYKAINEQLEKEAKEREAAMPAPGSVEIGQSFETGGQKGKEEVYIKEVIPGEEISSNTNITPGAQTGVTESESNNVVNPSTPAPAPSPAPAPEPTPAPAPEPTPAPSTENTEPQVGDIIGSGTTKDNGKYIDEIVNDDVVLPPGFDGGNVISEPTPEPAPEVGQNNVDIPIDYNEATMDLSNMFDGVGRSM